MDASNAFYELNRQVTLRNVEAICPVLAPILINTYHQDAFLFAGGYTIFSSEGILLRVIPLPWLCMLSELYL